MKLWILYRQPDDQGGYDSYDSVVVAAATEEEARLTHPSEMDYIWTGKKWRRGQGDSAWDDDRWTAPGKLVVREIGDAAPTEKAGVICASFNAG